MTAKKKSPVVVSVINLKGGVGKSTVTTLLAREISRRKQVLAVDLDPQANMSQALMGRDGYEAVMSGGIPSITDLFGGYHPPSSQNPTPEPLAQITQRVGANLYLVPSKFNFSQILARPARDDEHIVARFIADNMGDKDIVFIDCAPTESLLTQAAYHASHYVLIPVKPELFATIGFPLMKKSMDRYFSSHGRAMQVCGVLINNIQRKRDPVSKEARQALIEIGNLAGEYKWPVMKNQMYFYQAYRRKMRYEYHTDTRADASFSQIVKEFLLKINKAEWGGC